MHTPGGDRPLHAPHRDAITRPAAVQRRVDAPRNRVERHEAHEEIGDHERCDRDAHFEQRLQQIRGPRRCGGRRVAHVRSCTIIAVHMSPATRIRRNSDIIAAGLSEQTILLDPKDWTYVNFNETAARIWEALDEPRSVDSLVEALMRDYAVDRSTCEREVEAFVSDMSGRGFIVIEAA